MSHPWQNKLVVLSGASSGLGLHLALALAEQRAKLVLIGREPEKLEKTRLRLLEAGAAESIAFSLDVTDEVAWCVPQSQGARLRSFLDGHGIDLLVNIVGRSDRGLLENMKAEELMTQFRINVLSTFQMTKVCLPSLKRSRGTVVDIASLAGILAGPGMGGYSLSKHALVGMHRQWRMELQDSNVHFMLVCPGPMEREDSHERYKGLIESRNLDEKTARPGGGVRLKQLDPHAVSRRILVAASQRKLELVIPAKARWLAALISLCPSWGMSILRNRFR